MSNRRRFEYCFLRYVPNVVSDEGINLAVIFIDTNPENGICKMSFADEWEARVRLFDPNADVAMLTILLKDIQQQLLSADKHSEMIRLMEDSFSNAIQMTQWRSCPPTDNIKTIDAFARELVGKPTGPTRGSSAILGETCRA
jgi:hypothetical protein